MKCARPSAQVRGETTSSSDLFFRGGGETLLSSENLANPIDYFRILIDSEMVMLIVEKISLYSAQSNMNRG